MNLYVLVWAWAMKFRVQVRLFLELLRNFTLFAVKECRLYINIKQFKLISLVNEKALSYPFYELRFEIVCKMTTVGNVVRYYRFYMHLSSMWGGGSRIILIESYPEAALSILDFNTIIADRWASAHRFLDLYISLFDIT